MSQAVKNKSPWQFPETARDGLARDLVTASRDLAVEMSRQLNTMHFDATEQEIGKSESILTRIAKKLFAPIIASLPALAATIWRFSRSQFIKIDKKAGGNHHAILSMMKDKKDDWYKDESKKWIGVVEASIEKLYTDQVNDWVSNVRIRNLQQAPRKRVMEVTKERYAIYRSWAINRSEGMIGSWNSRLMRLNLESSGADSYDWHGWLDDREREAHILLENKTIGLNEVHIFPGEEYGCRCWAVPNYKGKK